MALQGTLETFTVAEVFRLLADTRKSGQLTLTGDQITTTVWLADGRVRNATRMGAGPAPVDGSVVDVFVDLLRLSAGSFDFDGTVDVSEMPGAGPLDRDVDDLLAAAEVSVAEWRELEAIIPSPDVIVTLAPSTEAATVTVTGDEWSLLAAVAGGRSAGAVSDSLGADRLETARRLRPLVELGLVVVEAPAAVPVATPAPSNDWMADDPEPMAGDDLEPWESDRDDIEVDATADDSAPVLADAVDSSADDSGPALSAKATAAIDAVTLADPDEPAGRAPASRDHDSSRSSLLRFLSAARS